VTQVEKAGKGVDLRPGRHGSFEGLPGNSRIASSKARNVSMSRSFVGSSSRRRLLLDRTRSGSLSPRKTTQIDMPTSPALENLGQMHTIPFPPAEVTDKLFLYAAFEVESSDVRPCVDRAVPQHDEVFRLGNLLQGTGCQNRCLHSRAFIPFTL
jgi:hypothetical protein